MRRLGAFLASLTLPIGGCASLDPQEEAGWIGVRDVPVIHQKTDYDCGLAALAMVLSHWGVSTTIEELARDCTPESAGIQAGVLRDFAKAKGLKCFVIAGKFSDLEHELSKGRPVMIGLLKPFADRSIAHYEVVIGLHPEKKRIALIDPASGTSEDSWDHFSEEWAKGGSLTIVLFRGE